MDSKFFETGNYIYECKTSPSSTRIGGYFDTSYLKSSINKLRRRWGTAASPNAPSGYRYVFPVNYLDNEAISLLQTLQSDYPSVDIKYYDCDQVQKLIVSLKKVGNLQSLVDYIEQARGK
jgi:hypothetical protein